MKKANKPPIKNTNKPQNTYYSIEEIKLLNRKTERTNDNSNKNNYIESNTNNYYIDNKGIYINQEKNSNPEDIQFLKDITDNSFNSLGFNNIFCVFKSIIDDILYLIYANKNSIISYNLIEYKKINEIKNSHNKDITNFRYCLDKINNRDLIISISKDDNNIKLWSAGDWNCLLNIRNINRKGELYSACFLNEKNKLYIITSNKSFGHSDPIKVFDLKGNKIKEIEDFNDKIFYIDTYYDNKYAKNYIITGNVSNVKSYDYNQNKIYHKYGNSSKRVHASTIVTNIKEIIKLIESSWDGVIRIWNFHSGELLRRIKSSNNKIFGLCLWNSKYLFIGCHDKTIKLIDLKNGKVIKNLVGHNNEVLTVKKIIHPKYGECLISESYLQDQLKLWINKNISINT